MSEDENTKERRYREWAESIAADKSPRYIRGHIIFFTILTFISGIQTFIFTFGLFVSQNKYSVGAYAAIWWVFLISTFTWQKIHRSARKLQVQAALRSETALSKPHDILKS